MILLRLLNANLTNFKSAYNTFLYAYGFELIREYEHYLEGKEPLSDKEFLKLLEYIYKESLKMLLEIQEKFRECVDFVYNLNGNESLKKVIDIQNLLHIQLKMIFIHIHKILK